jgi:predicted DNA-binding protein
MNKKIMTYSIRPETIERIRELARMDGRSASNYLDALIDKQWQKVIESGGLPHTNQTETPPGS